MKELMWKYLDGAYPRIYYKMTKFGTCLMDGNNMIMLLCEWIW